jgi:hypothetical protein
LSSVRGDCSRTFAKVAATGARYNQFGDAPDGYFGYAPDGRMYAIFTRRDRVKPADVAPTDEEGADSARSGSTLKTR